MKRLIYILLLLPMWLSAQVSPPAGVKNPGPLRRNGNADVYATHYNDLGNGGLHISPTIAGRDSLSNTTDPLQYGKTLLKDGMEDFVLSNRTKYRWHASTATWDNIQTYTAAQTDSILSYHTYTGINRINITGTVIKIDTSKSDTARAYYARGLSTFDNGIAVNGSNETVLTKRNGSAGAGLKVVTYASGATSALDLSIPNGVGDSNNFHFNYASPSMGAGVTDFQIGLFNRSDYMAGLQDIIGGLDTAMFKGLYFTVNLPINTDTSYYSLVQSPITHKVWRQKVTGSGTVGYVRTDTFDDDPTITTPITGTTNAFTLSATPVDTVKVYRNGKLLTAKKDYTLSGTSLNIINNSKTVNSVLISRSVGSTTATILFPVGASQNDFIVGGTITVSGAATTSLNGNYAIQSNIIGTGITYESADTTAVSSVSASVTFNQFVGKKEQIVAVYKSATAQTAVTRFNIGNRYNLVVTGTSIDQGLKAPLGADPVSYLAKMSPTVPLNVINNSQSGQSIDNASSSLSTYTLPLFNSSYLQNISIVDASLIINQYAFGGTTNSALLFSKYKALCLSIKGSSTSPYTIATTCIPSGAVPDSIITNFNTLVIANYASFSDVLVNFRNYPQFSGLNKLTNTKVYYSDKVHLTSYGDWIYASILYPAIAAKLGISTQTLTTIPYELENTNLVNGGNHSYQDVRVGSYNPTDFYLTAGATDRVKVGAIDGTVRNIGTVPVTSHASWVNTYTAVPTNNSSALDTMGIVKIDIPSFFNSGGGKSYLYRYYDRGRSREFMSLSGNVEGNNLYRFDGTNTNGYFGTVNTPITNMTSTFEAATTTNPQGLIWYFPGFGANQEVVIGMNSAKDLQYQTMYNANHRFYNGNTEKFRIDPNGYLSNTGTVATAVLDLKAGTADIPQVHLANGTTGLYSAIGKFTEVNKYSPGSPSTAITTLTSTNFITGDSIYVYNIAGSQAALPNGMYAIQFPVSTNRYVITAPNSTALNDTTGYRWALKSLYPDVSMTAYNGALITKSNFGIFGAGGIQIRDNYVAPNNPVFNPHIVAEFTSGTKLVQVPRMTDTQITAIGLGSSDLGSIGFSTTSNHFVGYDNTSVKQLSFINGTETLTNKTLTLPILTGYTVATLPAAGTAGRIAYVTDALTPSIGSTVVGGGSTFVIVLDNGTNWIAN